MVSPWLLIQTATGVNDYAGNLRYQGNLGVILSLTILGSLGSEMIIIDDVNTLPDFAGVVPAVNLVDNPNLGGTNDTELWFQGQGGTDTLIYNIDGASASQSYAIGDGSGTAGFGASISRASRWPSNTQSAISLGATQSPMR